MVKRSIIYSVFIILLLGPILPASGNEGCQVISGTLILEVARGYILSHAPWNEYDVTVEPKREMPDVPAYLQGKIDLEVEQARDAGLADVNLLKVRIDIGGKPYTKVDVGPYLSINLPVVVAAADIDRGQILSESDVALETRDLTLKHLNEPLIDTGQVVGMAAKQPLKQGDVLLSYHLDLPVLIERGKDATAIVTAAGMNITLTVQALDSGKMGDMVRVKNKTSGAIITAKVIGLGLVEVKI
jgi:flagella basal body P-ring formation protein FlgA